MQGIVYIIDSIAIFKLFHNFNKKSNKAIYFYILFKSDFNPTLILVMFILLINPALYNSVQPYLFYSLFARDFLSITL